MKISKARQARIEDYKWKTEALLKLCLEALKAERLGQWSYLQGRPISDYMGGGDRHEYDSIELRLPNDKGRIARHLPCLLDATQRDILSDMEWVFTIQQIVWAIREDALEAPGDPFPGSQYITEEDNWLPKT